MGRRKIEIQPITRKNGLFKKAYELGVLCSVDVAVIIFEERPGHHAKLYQYCSTDVNSMVQRHLRFDGERDTKGPSDFNNSSKADEGADDDDEAEEDDSTSKRRDSRAVKVKTENSSNSIVPIRPGPAANSNDASSSQDLDYRPNMRVSPAASTSSSSLPMSGERHTSGLSSATRSVPISSTAKRPRLALDDPSHLAQSAPAGMNHNHSTSSNHSHGSPTFPFRIDVDLPSSYNSSVIPSLSQLHSPHPSLNALYPSGMMGAPPHSFLSNSPFDLSRPSQQQQQQQQPLRGVTYSQSSASHYSPTGHQNPPSIFSRGTGGQGGGGGIFAELLGSGGEHGNGPGGHGSQFPSFDWPVHAGGTSQQGSQGTHENGTCVSRP
ncbi:hypothetical protein OH76DRAFT_1481923 [Lentinus brumalis]|uniref:MADS-box domain-containing protein n=1 Tax=Lentinus brumalis TaxID=2498619 RepID=A0A371DE72_9APHY|nr:hypothetical protein OH76DRAFT_1481923 [Polyporus brumalis]